MKSEVAFKSGQIINFIDDAWSNLAPSVWKTYISTFNTENVAKFKVVEVVEDLVRLSLMEICNVNGRVIINTNTIVDVHESELISSLNSNKTRYKC